MQGCVPRAATRRPLLLRSLKETGVAKCDTADRGQRTLTTWCERLSDSQINAKSSVWWRKNYVAPSRIGMYYRCFVLLCVENVEGRLLLMLYNFWYLRMLTGRNNDLMRKEHAHVLQPAAREWGRAYRWCSADQQNNEKIGEIKRTSTTIVFQNRHKMKLEDRSRKNKNPAGYKSSGSLQRRDNCRWCPLKQARYFSTLVYTSVVPGMNGGQPIVAFLVYVVYHHQ